jgi:hypothetical protein
MQKVYTFNNTDCAYIGKAFEMAVKECLHRKNPDRISPCGREDFIFNRKHYEVKQNGGVLKYSEFDDFLRGSKRIIYATHIAHNIVEITEKTLSVSISLAESEIFVLDREEFLTFLAENKLMKVNASRGTVNIQTCYNYKKNAYHGRAGKKIEEWAREHEIDDDIITLILDGEEE